MRIREVVLGLLEHAAAQQRAVGEAHVLLAGRGAGERAGWRGVLRGERRGEQGEQQDVAHGESPRVPRG